MPHRAQPCPLWCTCRLHTPASLKRRHAQAARVQRRLAAAQQAGEAWVNRDHDPSVTPGLRAYLAAFDEMVDAWRRGDDQDYEMARRLMTRLLHGERKK